MRCSTHPSATRDPRRRAGVCAGLALALLALCAFASHAHESEGSDLDARTGEPASPPTRRYADAHLHYVDFFQESEGMPALIEAMQAAGIEQAILLGMPVMKKWHEDEPQRPRYYQGDDAPLYWYSATDVLVAEAVQSLPAVQRRRFAPFISGFNPNDKHATRHVEAMLELYPGLWAGIGEVFTRHDDLTAMIEGETPRANNEAMQRIYRLAARHDLLVLLHSNLTSVRESEPIYLPELEEALQAHPRTRFLWAHAGTSAEIHRAQGRIPELRGIVEDLLERHDNLWVDLSWSVLEPYMLDAEGQPREAWLDLLRRHPDRFVIGSDVVGRFGSLQRKMREFDVVLDALPEDVADKIAHENLARLLRREG
jgi:hypothetical protein